MLHDESASLAPALAEQAESCLVSRVACGEPLAFESLYRIYRPRLTRFLDRMTRQPGMVDELLDDTMLVVWNRATRYNGQSKVSTWIFAIAYRKALRALHRLHPAMGDDYAEADDFEAAEPGPEQQAVRRELHEALLRALDGLSPQHRAVVDLNYFQGMGCREIASIVDCPIDTVKTRMFHARRRLKLLLGGHAGDWL